jgi:biotin carboxyl carrier protein
MKLNAISEGKHYTVDIVREENVYIVKVGGREYRVDFREPRESLYSLLIDGKAFEVGVEKDENNSFNVYFYDDAFTIEFIDSLQKQMLDTGIDAVAGKEEIVAPMSGKIVKVLKKKGDMVKSNEGIVIIEAMKMENELKASRSGKISRFLVKAGETVNASQVLAVIE